MKTNYKNTIVGAIVLSMLLAPIAGFAAETKTGIKAGIKAGAGFCTKIDTVSQKFLDELTSRTEKFSSKKDDRIAKLTENWNSRDENRTNNQNAQDERISARIDALMLKADTDEKKAAVNAFEEAANLAISNRRSAVDSAIETFRTGVSTLIDDKFGSLDENILTLNSSINEAINTAKSACTSGTSGEVVRTTLKDSVRAAYETFKNSKVDMSIKSEVEELDAVRKQSVNAAIAQFNTDMEKAKADLKAAFGAKQ